MCLLSYISLLNYLLLQGKTITYLFILKKNIMKTTFGYQIFLAAFLSIILFASCSKDQTLSKKVALEKRILPFETTTDLPPAIEYGGVSILFSPVDSKPALTISNSSFSSTTVEFTTGLTYKGEGYMIINKIPAGIYEVLVHPRNPAYRDFKIPGVTITGGRVSSLGKINF
jgi:hypothetical protein